MTLRNSNFESGSHGTYLHLDLEPLSAALSLAGSNAAAIKCYIAVCHRARVSKNVNVKFTTDLCQSFGLMDRKAKDRGLRFWEEVGLWTVVRLSGKNPVVQIIAAVEHLRRSVRLFRTQVRSIIGPHQFSTAFSEVYTARVITDSVRQQLEFAHSSSAFLGVELIDVGTGWIVDKIHPATTEHAAPIVTERHQFKS